MNNKWPKHLYALDVSRGIAALSVVLWHWSNFAYTGIVLSKDFVRENQPFYSLFRLFYEKGTLGVHYFFLLSGFIFFWLYADGIKKNLISAWNFSVGRVSRLYPLHFVTLVIVAALQYVYFQAEGKHFVYDNNDTYHFFLNSFFASYWGFQNGHSFNGPVWTVSIEILLYLIFFLVAMFNLSGWIFCLFIFVAASFLFLIFPNLILMAIAIFFLGGLTFHITNWVQSKYVKLTIPIYFISVFLWLLVIVNFYIFNLSGLFRMIGVSENLFLAIFPKYILFPFTIISLALFEINKGQLFKSFSWIGDITYSSYLLHFPLQILFALAVSVGILQSNFYLNPLYFSLYFSILIPLSYITFIKFERPLQLAIRNKLISNNNK